MARGCSARAGIDLYGAVGTHGQAGAQLLLALVAANGDHDDLLGLSGLADTQRLFQGDLVEGVDAHLDTVGVDPAAVRL